MKHGSILPVLVLLASVACLASGYRRRYDEQQLTEDQVAERASNLPEELRDLYDLIVDPSVDEINRENYIWRSFELLRYKKYRRYRWYYTWLLQISGPDQQQLGGQTPQGGRTPPQLGGRTPPKLGGRTPPQLGGRTPPQLGGRTPPQLGGRTYPGGRTPRRGWPQSNRDDRRQIV